MPYIPVWQKDTPNHSSPSLHTNTSLQHTHTHTPPPLPTHTHTHTPPPTHPPPTHTHQKCSWYIPTIHIINFHSDKGYFESFNSLEEVFTTQWSKRSSDSAGCYFGFRSTCVSLTCRWRRIGYILWTCTFRIIWNTVKYQKMYYDNIYFRTIISY